MELSKCFVNPVPLHASRISITNTSHVHYFITTRKAVLVSVSNGPFEALQLSKITLEMEITSIAVTVVDGSILLAVAVSGTVSGQSQETHAVYIYQCTETATSFLNLNFQYVQVIYTDCESVLKFLFIPQCVCSVSCCLAIAGNRIKVYTCSSLVFASPSSPAGSPTAHANPSSPSVSVSIENEKRNLFSLANDHLSIDECKPNSRISCFDCLYYCIGNIWTRYVLIGTISGLCILSVTNLTDKVFVTSYVFDCLITSVSFQYDIPSYITNPVSMLHDRASKFVENIRKPLLCLITGAIGFSYCLNCDIRDFRESIKLEISDKCESITVGSWNQDLIVIGTTSRMLLLYEYINDKWICSQKIMLAYPITDLLFFDCNNDGIKELVVLTTFAVYIYQAKLESIHAKLTDVLNLLEEIKFLEKGGK